MSAKTSRNYLNFTTPTGVELTAVAKSGLSSFLIHECGYRPSLTGWNHEGVDSPFWRFYYNPSAGNFIRFKGEKISLQPDRVLLIPAYTVFDCCGPAPAQHFWIHFSVTRPGAIALTEPVVINVDATIRPALKSALELQASAPSELRAQRLYHVAAALLHLSFSQLDAQLSRRFPDKLHDLLGLVHGAPHSDLSNSFLAARAGMSVEKFIRWFKQHLRQTPANYVSQARIGLACDALALSDKSIEQVADELGFPNRFYFSRVFARQMGCGPAEFRQRHRTRKGIARTPPKAVRTGNRKPGDGA